jgi:NADH-quinone oxidoreductase subunit M
LLWLYQRVMFGTVTNPVNETLPDLNAREYATLLPLVALAFWIGIYPKPLFNILDQPVKEIVEHVNPGYYNASASASAPAATPVAADPAAAPESAAAPASVPAQNEPVPAEPAQAAAGR